jgi:hypothetical protein
VQALVIVEPEIAFDPGARFRHRLVVLQVRNIVLFADQGSLTPDPYNIHPHPVLSLV